MFSKTTSKQAPSFSDRKQRFYEFLDNNPVGVLSTVTPDGDPHGVVIYYVIDKNFIISFLTRAETRKRDNIKHNNHVMLTVYEPRTQTTVQIVGTAKEVTDSYEVNGIAGAVMGVSTKIANTGLPPISKLEAGSYVGFRITPEQIRMAVYSRPDPGEYGDIFESIESFDLDEA